MDNKKNKQALSAIATTFLRLWFIHILQYEAHYIKFDIHNWLKHVRIPNLC